MDDTTHSDLGVIIIEILKGCDMVEYKLRAMAENKEKKEHYLSIINTELYDSKKPALFNLSAKITYDLCT